MNSILVVASKEILDGLRDSRSVVAGFFYALMGPAVVGLVSASIHGKTTSGASVLTSMMAVFTVISAFVGGMNVAMDTVAGERERKSLLPLLLCGVSRKDIALGKWAAVSFFATAGLALNTIGFAIVLAASGMHIKADVREMAVAAFGLFSLPLLASAVQLLISTTCRGVKEAQTYLSLATFVPMGIGMFLVFCPGADKEWCRFLPLAGQQSQLGALISGQKISSLQPLALGYLTLAVAVLVLLVAANRLQRDEIIYGN